MKTAAVHVRNYLVVMKYDRESKYDELLFKEPYEQPVYKTGNQLHSKKIWYKSPKRKCLPYSGRPESTQMRHTAAMELLASGVDLMYIRDLLGHSSITLLRSMPERMPD